MRIVRIAVAAASFAMLPAAYAFATTTEGNLAPADAPKHQRLAMSDGSGVSSAGPGWTPFPDKDRAAKPEATPAKEPVVRAEDAAKKKAKVPK